MPLLHRPSRRALACLLLWSIAWPTLVLATPSQTPEPEWTLSADGSQLLQRSTRLLWQRCVEGMRWTGRDCVGEPLWLDHGQAQARARQRAQAEGVSWRMPHLKELRQLAKLGATKGQPKLLSASTQGWVWSGTVPIEIRSVNAYNYSNIMQGVTGQNVNQMKFLHGWVVNTATAESRDDVLRRTPMLVHLVRRAD